MLRNIMVYLFVLNTLLLVNVNGQMTLVDQELIKYDNTSEICGNYDYTFTNPFINSNVYVLEPNSNMILNSINVKSRVGNISFSTQLPTIKVLIVDNEDPKNIDESTFNIKDCSLEQIGDTYPETIVSSKISKSGDKLVFEVQSGVELHVQYLNSVNYYNSKKDSNIVEVPILDGDTIQFTEKVSKKENYYEIFSVGDLNLVRSVSSFNVNEFTLEVVDIGLLAVCILLFILVILFTIWHKITKTRYNLSRKSGSKRK